MHDRPIRVGLPWHFFGHPNLGVDALTRANFALLQSAAARIGRAIHGVTLGCAVEPYQGEIPPNASVGPRVRVKPLLRGRSEYGAELRSCDLVVDIGEGDSWADIYGFQRFAYQAGTKAAAIAMGKPLVLAPQTIGPFDHRASRIVADAIMNRARAVFTRDGQSTAYLRERGIKAQTAEYIDVAFALPFTPMAKRGDGFHVGLNVSGLLYRGGYGGKNELGMAMDYRAYTHGLIEALLARPDTQVHLFGHVVGGFGNDDDLSVIPELVARYPALHAFPRFSHASEAKSHISSLDLVIAGRMHACIGAFSAGVPVIPVAYSRKFNGLFGTLGYPHFVDGKASDTQDALDQTIQAVERTDVLKADLERGLTEAKRRLAGYEDALVTILREVAGG